MKSRSKSTRQDAEILAIQALAFIAEEPDRLGAFVGSTGVAIDDIRSAAREAGFLAGVLDHMLADESLLLSFAGSVGIDPAAVGRARHALGGNWERDLP